MWPGQREPTHALVRAKAFNRRALLGVTATSWTIALLLLLFAIRGWSPSGPLLLLLLPALAAWTVRRASLVAAFYLGQIAVYFGVTPLVQGQDRSPILIAIVAIW